jgi:hypothetical protein
MTNRSWRFRTLPVTLRIFLVFCSLALLVSVASPADDAIQQEAAPCRTRHVVRVSKTSRPVPPQPSRTTPALATPSVRLPFAPAHYAGLTAGSILLPDETYPRHIGERGPPCFLL